MHCGAAGAGAVALHSHAPGLALATESIRAIGRKAFFRQTKSEPVALIRQRIDFNCEAANSTGQLSKCCRVTCGIPWTFRVRIIVRKYQRIIGNATIPF